MEHFKPEPPKEEVKKKPAIWNKVREYGKVIALTALLSAPSIESALGQEKGEKEDIKTKIEKLKEKAGGHVKSIAVAMKEKGWAGKMNNRIPTRNWKSQDKEVSMTVGYSDDESKAEWLTHENSDASMTYFDKGADGSVDRVVINNENPKLGARQKSLYNQFKIYDSMQNLANKADILSGLKPEDVKVYEISFENDNFVIRAVDFQSGEASEFDGPGAAELAGKVQGAFTNSMEKADGQLKK